MLSLLIFLSFKKRGLAYLTKLPIRFFSHLFLLFFCFFSPPAFGAGEFPIPECNGYYEGTAEHNYCVDCLNRYTTGRGLSKGAYIQQCVQRKIRKLESKKAECSRLLLSHEQRNDCENCKNITCVNSLIAETGGNSPLLVEESAHGVEPPPTVAEAEAPATQSDPCADFNSGEEKNLCKKKCKGSSDMRKCVKEEMTATMTTTDASPVVAGGSDNTNNFVENIDCTERCKGYITDTTDGCPDQNITGDDCQRNCHNSSGKNREVAQAVKQTIAGRRPACVTEAKNEYVKSFKTQCKSQITGVETAKGRKIACGGEGEDSCDTYCETKAKNTYGTSVTEDDIFLGYNFYRYHHTEIADLDQSKVVSYKSVTEDPKDVAVEQVEIKFTPDIISAELEDDDSNNLSWASCEVGSCGNAEFELTEALDDALETCHELETEALECCHNPEECVGGNLAKALDSINKGYLAVSSTRSRKAMCKAVENVYGLFAGMQGAMATQCTKKSNKCIDECETHLLTVATKMEKACGANFSPNRKPTYSESTYTCSEEFFKKYITPYYEGTNNKQRLLTEVPKDCKTTGNNANSRIEDMSSNAIASIVASREECKRDPSTSRLVTDPEDPPPPPTVEIPPPPEEETGDGSGGKETDYAVGDDTSPDPTPGIPDDDDPLEEEPGLVPETPKGGGPGGLVSGQGGGGLGGLGGMGGGGPRGGNRRGPGGEKKKESLLLGLLGSKFKGYLSGSPDNNEGGGKGVGKAKSKKASKLAELDLNKILPKSRIFQKVGKYGAPHENIFEKVSTRIEYMCRTKRLDCSR